MEQNIRNEWFKNTFTQETGLDEDGKLDIVDFPRFKKGNIPSLSVLAAKQLVRDKNKSKKLKDLVIDKMMPLLIKEPMTKLENREKWNQIEKAKSKIKKLRKAGLPEEVIDDVKDKLIRKGHFIQRKALLKEARELKRDDTEAKRERFLKRAALDRLKRFDVMRREGLFNERTNQNEKMIADFREAELENITSGNHPLSRAIESSLIGLDLDERRDKEDLDEEQIIINKKLREIQDELEEEILEI